MSAPKKGKDLSALKARLAKKAAESEGGAGAAAPGADLPPPAEAAASLPAPGEVQKPPMADIPAPGEVKKPIDIPAPGEVSKPVDIPAPGEVRSAAPESEAPPAPAPAPAQKKGDIADDPMSGGVAFDPNAGLIDDVGEIKSKSGIGLPIFAALIGIVVGGGLGWMAHKATDSRDRVDAARKKAESIQAKVDQIETTRARIALKVGEGKDALEAKEPQKAIDALSELEPTFIELGDLFGWQLAAMDPVVVKKIFELADANNRLQLDVGMLKGWVSANSEILANRTTGPSSFVVVRNPNGGSILTEYVAGICGEVPDALPEDLSTLANKCEGDAILNANAFVVRTAIGGELSVVSGEQGMMLIPDGQIYTYAIGATPDANAKTFFDISMGRIQDTLASMVKLKDDALEGIKHYTDDPPVNAN